MTRSTDTARFLLVDDDAVGILSMQRAMKRLGLENPTRIAGDGLEALQILEDMQACSFPSMQPVIVALDINMPRMGGLEFLAELEGRRALPPVSVLLYTPHGEPLSGSVPGIGRIAGYLDKDAVSASLQSALASIDDSDACGSQP
jgi:CheY-like chemotaxis protein